MVHSPARWPPNGRPETSRLLKVNHSMLHVRIEMRLGAYASSRQDTDYAGAGGGQEFGPGSTIEGPACLIQVCISYFRPLSHVQDPPGRRGYAPRLQRPSSGFKGLWISGAGSAEQQGILQRHSQGCVGPSRGPKILSFLFRPRLVCSLLLHLRSSWKVKTANFALCVFSRVLHSSGPMRHGFLCNV